MNSYNLSWIILSGYIAFCYLISKVAPKEQFELFIPFILVPLLAWWIKTYKQDIFDEIEHNINILILVILALVVIAIFIGVPWLLSKIIGEYNDLVGIIATIVLIAFGIHYYKRETKD